MELIKYGIILILLISCKNSTETDFEENSLNNKIYSEFRKTHTLSDRVVCYEDLLGTKVIFDEQRGTKFIFFAHMNSTIEYELLFYSIELNKLYITKRLILPHGDIITGYKDECFKGILEYINDKNVTDITSEKLFFQNYFSFFYKSEVSIEVDHDKELIKLFVGFSKTRDVLILEFIKRENEFSEIKYYFNVQSE